MVFNSIEYLFFLPIVLVLFFIVPQKIKCIVLLIASYYFYMSWNPKYIILLLFFTIFNYYIALRIDKNNEKTKRKRLLIISVVTNLSMLFIFKYLNFFVENVNILLNALNIQNKRHIINIILPMGISFYTFQTLSYVIDVYNKKINAEKNIGIFALYVSFFPQLVAGPIERSSSLLPQFYKKHKFDYDNVTNGLKIMAWGFFKKIVIADRIAVMVNVVYNNPQKYTGLPLILATFAFGIQIYCDFSGYSDIAIGTAKIMGFNLMQNFNRPYFSKSISEFWRRWHISLSSWLRDYVYIPLGGSRVSKNRTYLNLFITFLISGIWHGANWTFISWGALHGIYLVLGKVLKPAKDKLVKIIKLDRLPAIHKFISIILTNLLVMFAWIFFRANSMNDAIYIIKNLFVNLKFALIPSYFISTIFNLGLNNVDTVIIVFSVLILIIVSIIERKESWISQLQRKSIFFRFSVYYVLIMYLIFFMYYSGNSKFIYFQF